MALVSVNFLVADAYVAVEDLLIRPSGLPILGMDTNFCLLNKRKIFGLEQTARANFPYLENLVAVALAG